MKVHYAITRTVDLLARWRDAFPLGRFFAPDALPPADAIADGVVWFHSESRSEAGLGDAVKAVRARFPGLPVVVLSSNPVQGEALQALNAGAVGYCHALSSKGLFHQIDVVVRNGGLWLGAELMRRMLGSVADALQVGSSPLASRNLDQLSPREREVVLAVARGATNKEAARGLGITERTVKAHLGAAFEKLGVRDRLQLVIALKPDAVLLESAA